MIQGWISASAKGGSQACGSLVETDGRIYGEGGAAERAGLKPTTLQSKLKKRGLR